MHKFKEIPISIRTYYKIKRFIPRPLQIAMRRVRAHLKLRTNRVVWPINPKASSSPLGWTGWPEGKKFALVLTHDVDTQRGHDRCEMLLNIEKDLGYISSFNFVAKKYNISDDLFKIIRTNGFEIGVHGLYHDGKYFKTRENFNKRAIEINYFLDKWGASGFRAPAMHHNLEWILDLNILYDLSTFDTDPFEPQSDGVTTIFPFWFSSNHNKKRGYVELPYTLPQDFTLFVLLKEKTIDVWKKKLDWIAGNGGMALLIVHPDYINFGNGNNNAEEYNATFYIEFLKYVSEKYKKEFWNPLPKDIAKYWIDAVVMK